VIMQTVGGALKRVHIFKLAKGLKLGFEAQSGRGGSLVQPCCKSCVYF